MTVADVLAKEAGWFYGEGAVKEGLADGVTSFDRCFELAAADAARFIAARALQPMTRAPMRAQGRDAIMGDKNQNGRLGGESVALPGEVLSTLESGAGPIAVALGLDSTASIAQCQAEIQRRGREQTALLAQIGASTMVAAIAKVEALQDELSNARIGLKKLEELQKQSDNAEGEKLIESALDEGRILPAEETKVRAKFAANGVGWLRDYVDTRVPNPALAREAREVHQREDAGVVRRQGGGHDQVQLTEDDLKVIEMTGVSKEKYLEQKKKLDAAGNPLHPSARA